MANKKATSERNQLLKRVENFFEVPMIVLGFVWLALLVVELVYQSSPALETFGAIIWIIFILDFCVKLLIAPEKLPFLKKNVITIVSLAVPALRVFRIARILRLFRFSRGLRLVKVVGTLNRGMRALAGTMKRRAFGYVFFLTILILFGGAAGMYAFENQEGAFEDYGDALWWTSMIITTMGSDYWPKTMEGRVLCIIIALYAFAVFGYVTATIATFFIGRDAEDAHGADQIESLRKEVHALRTLLENKNKGPDLNADETPPKQTTTQ